MKGSEVLGLLKLQTKSSHKAQNRESSKELPVSLKTAGFCTILCKKKEALVHLWYTPVCAAAVWDVHLTWTQKTQCSMRNDFPISFNHDQTIQTHQFIAANIVHYVSQGHSMFFSFNVSPFSLNFRGSNWRDIDILKLSLITSLISRLLKLYW